MVWHYAGTRGVLHRPRGQRIDRSFAPRGLGVDMPLSIGRESDGPVSKGHFTQFFCACGTKLLCDFMGILFCPCSADARADQPRRHLPADR